MNTTWPLLLDMTKEESIQYLRNLELEAYSHLVSALRAQGPLNSDKRKLLKDTSEVLNITQERYKAEIRRAISDERLNTIAYHVSGQNGSVDDWAQEGRRVIPLLPRMAPQTCYSALADEIADATSQTNKQLPSPSTTERKRVQNQQPPNVVECNTKVQVPFRIPETPIKPQDECKKRKLPICTENSSLAQHLLGPAKMSRIQQLYRQRTKAKTKSQPHIVKNKQEDHHPIAKQYQKYMPPPPPPPPVTTSSPKINVLQNISLQPPIATTTTTTTTSNSGATTTEMQNDLQNSSKVLKHVTLKPLTAADMATKTIKMCTTTTTTATTTTSATIQIKKSPLVTQANPIMTTTAPPVTKTVNSGQKLIVVSNAPTLQSNSILQRTLSIPFVKNISVKNIEKFKIVTTNSQNLNVTTITNTLNTNNSSVKHKVVTVRTNPNTANKKVIPLSQIQMLNTKGGSSIKVLPLTGKIVGKTTTASSTTPLYIVNPANNKPTISVTTITKQQPEIETTTKEENVVLPPAVVEVAAAPNTTHACVNKENTNKSSVLEDILKASGVINEDYDEKISEFHIVQKSHESELEESINNMKEEHDTTIIEVKPESGDEATQDVIQTHEIVLHEEDVINDTILETNSNDINEFK